MAKDDQLYVGVDLGGTGIKIGVVDAKNRVVVTGKSKTKSEEGSDAVVKRILKGIRDTLDEGKIKASDIGGLGIGAPGTIDIEKGVVVNATNLRWNKFPLAKLLAEDLRFPVTLDNDVNVGTWGEHIAGAGRGFNDLLGVFVGTGIGGGVILNGRLYHGHFLTAGEIGHTVLDADAQLGRRTLENRASRTAIASLLTQLIQTNHHSKLIEITGGDLASVRSKAIAQALDADDRLTRDVVKRAARYVGIAIANVVTVMSLPCVVLGGGLTEALGKPWVEWVRESFEEVVFPPELRECKILRSELDDDAGVIGAAALARARLGNGKE